MLHVDEPLERQARFDRNLCTLRKSHIIYIVFDLFHQIGFGEVAGDFVADNETVLAHIQACDFGHGSIFVEDVDRLEVVCLAEHVVILVVGRSDFQTAGAEINLHISVLDNGNFAVDKRHNHFFAFEPGVFGVFRVYAHSSVAHDGLRAGGGYHCIQATVVVYVHHIPLFSGFGNVERRILTAGREIIAQVVEFRLLLLEVHFVIRDGCAVNRVPVDHAEAAVNQPLFVKVAENLCDRFRTQRIHCESGAVPVA